MDSAYYSNTQHIDFEYVLAMDDPVTTPSDTDGEIETERAIGTADGMSLDEIILTIPAELPLPSAEREVTKITIGKEIKIPGVDEKNWEGDSAVNLKVIDLLSDILSFVLEELKQQAVAHRIRWDRPCCSILFEGRLTSHRVIPDHTISEVSSQRQYDETLPLQLSTQIATTGLDVVDVRRVVREHYQELNAKINSLDEQVAATRNDLLDFRAQAQQTPNIITAQLSELVAYINRGGNDKKGEVSSSRPQPPPDEKNRGSGNTGGGGDSGRSIVERLMTADWERQREKIRGHSSSSYKRRRY
ncbi:hypothetical protein F511_33837 [Dorcoceras hygrometricum]|uniref:Uncharacterized protein n=1 Tax=Dorcoceras hygrometricum TaxID=472368 RepID=A0A2Z7BXR9_9LAMI|nr:hypothetical protein F511_33837 [Dorcoceras hygrometricum]